jgi:alpha-tubulin suppressor-like RCC1 family protein
MASTKSGVIFVSERDGELEMVNDLVGKKFYAITSNESGILVSSNEGHFVVGTEGVESVSKNELKSISGGDKFQIGVGIAGNLYSWGVGNQGQLGQGAARQVSVTPEKIKYHASFVSVCSGQSFSVAQDVGGQLYCWGEVWACNPRLTSFFSINFFFLSVEF